MAVGGGLVSVVSGTYTVNDLLLHHARIGYTVKHPSILGPQLAHDFASSYGGQAFVVNPPDVNEFPRPPPHLLSRGIA